MTGVICVYKEKGITSFGVCSRIRAITGEKKCGHTGTLDPMATGVLPVMLGGATKFLDFFPETDKEYRASFVLGITTDTLDITGNVTAEYDVDVSVSDVLTALDRFHGKIKQLPPMYSAVSLNGQRLYDLARRGIEVVRSERTAEIKNLSFVGEKNGEFTIDVLCSKGTYIRTLIDDLGRDLGCGAVMTALERKAASGFLLEDCISVDELQRRKNEGIGFADILLPVDKILSEYDKITVSPAQSVRFKNGGALDLCRLKSETAENALYRVYEPSGQFLGLGQAVSGELKVKRVFIDK